MMLPTEAELDEIENLDKVLPGPCWMREQVQDGEILSDGTGYAGDFYDTMHIVTEPCAENDGAEDPVVDWCYSADVARFVVLARRLLPQLARYYRQTSPRSLTAEEWDQQAEYARGGI